MAEREGFELPRTRAKIPNKFWIQVGQIGGPARTSFRGIGFAGTSGDQAVNDISSAGELHSSSRGNDR